MDVWQESRIENGEWKGNMGSGLWNGFWTEVLGSVRIWKDVSVWQKVLDLDCGEWSGLDELTLRKLLYVQYLHVRGGGLVDAERRVIDDADVQ